jgi:hypothetical protein
MQADAHKDARLIARALGSKVRTEGGGNMSWYIDSSVIVKSDGNKDWWKKDYSPSETVPV